MQHPKQHLILIAAAVLAFTFPACKAKKIVQADPAPVAATPPAPAPTPTPTPAPVEKKEVMVETAPVSKPNFNFSNIQFEFDSPILKTDSYPALDAAVTEMKKAPSAKFILNGYSSAEGTPEHNMTLSQERANSVKVYLVNSGIADNALSTKGNGESNPVADNSTESGKVLNRRVEIRVVR